MTELTYESFPQQLCVAVPGFDRVYDEHVAEYDEILPHVLLGELVRFLSREVQSCSIEGAALGRAVMLLERAMGSADPRLQELVAVSFLENLDPADPSFAAIRTHFGPKLEEQYKRYEDARR